MSDDPCKTPFPRKSCIQCALKHISQARVLMLEVHKDYPEHRWFAMGHMAEAEDELCEQFPSMSKLVRQERIKLEQDEVHNVPWGGLIRSLVMFEKKLANDVLSEIYGNTEEI